MGEGRRFEREESFGGLVLRGEEVLVIVPAGKALLALPKGGAEPGETGEATALREVREETGITAVAREPLGDVTYEYRRRGVRVAKVVHFFLCEYVEGSTHDHDHEVDDARFIPLTEARTALAYPGERALAERALLRLTAER